MLNPEILRITDTAMAVILSLGFLIAFLIDRKLAAFRWWAGVFALIAVPVATTGMRMTALSHVVEILSWTSLYAAICLASLGMYIEDENPIRPIKAISVGWVVLGVIVIGLTMTGAPSTTWALWGVVPSVGFILWSVFNIVRQKPRSSMNLVYAAMLFVGALLISLRSVWFANVYSYPPLVKLYSASYVDQALLMTLATILAMVGLAVVLTLRISLTAIYQMQERSSIDGMTGLLNRASFDEQAERLLARSGDRPVCAIILDIDHFKRVNDTFGHQTGDRVISSLGYIICSAGNDDQIAGRIGGEEFAILLPNATLTTGRLYAEALRTRFAICDHGGAISWTVTLSAGIAMRDKNEPLHTLLARADKALYTAKNRGRDRVVVGEFDSDLNPKGLMAS